MSRGSTTENGFPCPMCGKRSLVTQSVAHDNTRGIPVTKGTIRRRRKCVNGCRPFWTTERVDGTAPVRFKMRVSQLKAHFSAMNEKRRGLIWRMMQHWEEEDLANKKERSNGPR